MAERLGTGLQNRLGRFDSACHLHFLPLLISDPYVHILATIFAFGKKRVMLGALHSQHDLIF